MIDLEKERELFKSAMISAEIHEEKEFEVDGYGNFSWIGTDESFEVWLERAELAKSEQKKLEAEIESLKAQLAQYQSDDYVLVPKELTDEICEAIARTANVCGGIANDIYEAMIEAQEQHNEQM